MTTENDDNNVYITNLANHQSQVLLPKPGPKKTTFMKLLSSNVELKMEIFNDLIRDDPQYVRRVLNEIDKEKGETASLSEHSFPSKGGQDEFEKNVEAYKKMEGDLIKDPNYNGLFVVFYKQNIVAKGNDKVKLMRDAYNKYGYVPILIHRVGKKRIIHFRSPHRKGVIHRT